MRHKYCRVVKRQTHPPVSGAEKLGQIFQTNHSVKVRILPLQQTRPSSKRMAFFMHGSPGSESYLTAQFLSLSSAG